MVSYIGPMCFIPKGPKFHSCLTSDARFLGYLQFLIRPIANVITKGFCRTLIQRYSHTTGSIAWERHSNLFGYPRIIELKFQADWIKTEGEIVWQFFAQNSKL